MKTCGGKGGVATPSSAKTTGGHFAAWEQLFFSEELRAAFPIAGLIQKRRHDSPNTDTFGPIAL